MSLAGFFEEWAKDCHPFKMIEPKLRAAASTLRKAEQMREALIQIRAKAKAEGLVEVEEMARKGLGDHEV